MSGWVVSERNEWQYCVPVGVLPGDVHEEHVGERSVVSLQHAVCLGMVRSGGFRNTAVKFENAFLNGGREAALAIG